MLDNFEAEISKTNRKRWKIASMISFAFLLLLFIFLFTSAESSPEEIEKEIADSPKLHAVNQLCDKLPKLGDFIFVSKKIYSNSEQSSIAYYYQGAARLADVKDFYANYFEQAGWESESNKNDEIKYRNKKSTIHIERATFPSANYIIGCSQEK